MQDTKKDENKPIVSFATAETTKEPQGKIMEKLRQIAASRGKRDENDSHKQSVDDLLEEHVR